ncbi:MAG: cellulase family glycosylhydrolase [Anaerolineaceae bacterium]|nr:cellulase family glycosylhydrolase [Anaerolineaceae bacterium]
MTETKWSIEKANEWYRSQPWLRGCNFIPSTAINQLEMWQTETFDLETIDRELGWAADLGLNAMRVYLHDLLWQQDAAGFKQRIDQYLTVAEKHGIKTIFVLFDDCWHDHPRLGTQPAPRPGVHNSGWVKGPGTKVLKDPTQCQRLEEYVKDIITAYGKDQRVVCWDIYNEPGNNFLISLNLPSVLRVAAMLWQLIRHQFIHGPTKRLMRHAFAWAREVHPEQPLTAGLYYLRPILGAKLNPLCLALSDVVSFHSYFNLKETENIVAKLEKHGRPLVCTEYMGRNAGSTFETIMPLYKEHKIAAINWGLVAGKTQTMYSWEDYYPDGQEPPLWYHDILRPDGTPYKYNEAQFIKRITK